MSKPVLLIVDDDTETCSRLKESLQREYGNQFRVLQARSGSTALETLEALKQHDELVALLLVSAQMKMSGMNFFEQAVKLFPHAKRVLYTGDAEADIVPETDEIRVHACLSKPWHEPEVCLYPMLEDLLEDREKTVQLPAEEVQIICQRWSPKAHEITDMLQ